MVPPEPTRVQRRAARPLSTDPAASSGRKQSSPGVTPKVLDLNAHLSRLANYSARVFPEHVFVWHRPTGDRTIRLGTQIQFMAITGTAMIVGWLGLATLNMADGKSAADLQLAAKQVELARLQTQIAAVKADASALRGDVAERAAALEARQAFLATLLSGQRDASKLAALMPRAGGVATAAALLPGVSGNRGADVLAPFNRLESEQLAFVDRATDAAEARLKDTQALIRRLGLDPSRFNAQTAFGPRTASGGPYVPVSADAEPRFRDLYTSWKKVEALETALAAVPSFVPVKTYSLTSGYGVRYDPFTGRAATHAGLDMAGAHGEPVYAAADGVVLRSGRYGAYGNLVELSHGKGIDTRYGHLSAISVAPGARVRQGQVIGRMGSTGRSTGTHLHYEIRVDGQAVNPRPFLAASAYMLAAQNRGGPVADQPELPAEDETLAVEGGVTVIASGTIGATGNMTPIRIN